MPRPSGTPPFCPAPLSSGTLPLWNTPAPPWSHSPSRAAASLEPSPTGAPLLLGPLLLLNPSGTTPPLEPLLLSNPSPFRTLDRSSPDAAWDATLAGILQSGAHAYPAIRSISQSGPPDLECHPARSPIRPNPVNGPIRQSGETFNPALRQIIYPGVDLKFE